MKSKGYMFNYKALLATVIGLAIFSIAGFFNLKIDPDIVGSLPKKDPVLSDASYVLQHHPMQDLVAIDIHYQEKNPDILVEAGNFVQKELINSRLFDTVGMEAFEDLIPDILIHVSKNLPVLFSEKDLTEIIAPLLTPDNIKKKLKENYTGLQDINSVGIAEMLSHDPLGLSDHILAKLLYLSPSQNAQFYDGQLISKNGSNLLLIASPATSGTDTDFARKTTALIHSISENLNRQFQDRGFVFTINHIGSYRYALDNETIAKKDTKKAIFFAALGIALMLVVVFPRPLIGLFSFLPAIVGTVMSFFVYSLFHKTISILALGFGGAIISISVDHGIAYLLFLDQKHETLGKDAAQEVWSVGLLATLTTVFAFLSLFISGFPVLNQVGQFAAFGILFSFIFVHTIFPCIFPKLPPATHHRPIRIQQFVNRIAVSSATSKIIIAAALFVGLIFFAKPVFHVDLSSLNTIRPETSKSEKYIQQTWGNVSDKIFLLAEAQSIEALQTSSDKIAALLEQDISAENLAPTFISSMIYPGIKRSNDNFTAWKNFWTTNKKAALKSRIKRNAVELGFSASAFDPFFNQIDAKSFNITPIPEKLFTFLGIEKNPSKDNNQTLYRQFYTLTPGKNYHAEPLTARYGSAGTIKMFDPDHFTNRLGKILTEAFIRMFIIISVSLTLFLIFFFVDLKLTITALLPVGFAFICTLGTLKLLSHPIDIPGLMLSIVVLGMGIDYSLYLVRSRQRYLNDTHPSFVIIRTAVFLASLSTLIGFGVMCFSSHALLKSAGITSFFGILYSLVGAFFILPFLLNRLFDTNKKPVQKSKFTYQRTPKNVLKYYKHLEGFVRIYARMKLKFDPMYKELGELLQSPRRFIDIGCGYGVTAIWILDHFPESTVFGIEPNFERARIAANAIQQRGVVVPGEAPDLPKLPKNSDLVLMIDIAHYLSDDSLKHTLKKIHVALNSKGLLLIRSTIPVKKRFSLVRWVKISRMNLFNIYCNYRTVNKTKSIISQSGYQMISVIKSGKNHGKVWFLAGISKTG